ncbi:TPA: glycosyltransferase [Enterobacter kobei]|uniref:glycosyltransferase n=1 Tax=Enterobacter kobei TaxID=208224 RepID=UPI000B3BFB70|nr:glycosyltransferase [Enterobacter kobei]MBT1797963.1 glycosyltransferase [Enterobacter kobei]MBW7696046.1 glycosyltransferase [Enterobacter kobei]MBW7771745.1 glycosyltransferase [Enterobacter kobei]MCK6863138.1 glycosyltransferase [Enterobacter kobei]MCO7420072.1 glycosyltransferase [Enterobacter kobei]
MQNKKFDVSVVIPTIGRGSVFNAIESVLKQKYQAKEIILAYDGDDFNSFEIDAKKFINNTKDSNGCLFQVINVGPFSGGNVARQSAINIASFPFIALLDDDDIWLDNHLSDYYEIFNKKNTKLPVLFSCRSEIVDITHKRENVVVPQRCIEQGESIPDYLFRINKLVADCGFIQSSLMLFSRELALSVPFLKNLRYHQDIDWLLRLSESDVCFEFVQSKNVTVTYMSTPLSVSKNILPMQSVAWALGTFKEKRNLGDFLLTQSFNYAQSNGSFVDEIKVLIIALKYATPGRYSMIRYFIKLLRINKILSA